MSPTEPGRFLPAMWAALGETGSPPAVHGGIPPLPSRLHAAELVRDAIATASLAAARLAAVEPDIRLDTDRVATAVTSDRHLRLDGAAPDVWSPTSGFFAARDGWVRTHTNYPHHRTRLLAALELPADATPETLAARVAELDAGDLERRALAADALAVAVRDPDGWAREPASEALAGEPVVRMRTRTRRNARPPRPAPTPSAAAPLAGVRVLDLTRVIAGPVATRTLALLGAEVLRLDAPGLPEPDWQHADTGAGKRSALLDLGSRNGREAAERLLSAADIVVLGYRPRSLARFGLSPERLASEHPELVIGSVSAWGGAGSWSERRGFDSLVQAATGIAALEGGERPGALPMQALDHTAGYLLAAALLTAVRRRSETGEPSTVAVSLIRIATELLAHGIRRVPRESTGFTPTLAEHDAGGRRLTLAEPALAFPGAPTSWPAPPGAWGADAPEWRKRDG